MPIININVPAVGKPILLQNYFCFQKHFNFLMMIRGTVKNI